MQFRAAAALVLAGMLGCLPARLEAAVEMFLRIDGIPGESADPRHPDEIVVLDMEWGLSQSVSLRTGGVQAGRVSVSELQIRKWTDRSSPKLLLHASNGAQLREAVLTVRKTGIIPVEYYKIKIRDVLITRHSTQGAAGDDRMAETASFAFAKVETTYFQIESDGTTRGAGIYFWDVEKNEGSATVSSSMTDFDGDGLLDTADPDDDNDGMPDLYERQYGLLQFVNDAALDHDGDGLTNLEELQVGTSPVDRDSVLKATLQAVALPSGDLGARTMPRHASSNPATSRQTQRVPFPLHR